MAPVFAHGQLRLYLLSLLEAGPRHGYELITALSDRFAGTYRPSPGTVYPRLARLEEEGLVVRHDDGRKATYALTDAGRQELAARAADLGQIEEDLAASLADRADDLREEARAAMRGLRAELAAAAQQARTSARPGVDELRSSSHARRMEADALLRRFVDEVRADLRRADAGTGVPQLTVDTLRTVLDGALAATRSTLR